MKTISPELTAHLASNPTTLAYLWKVKRSDGTIMGFTNFDVDITYTDGDGDTVTYLAGTGFANTAAANKSDLSVDNIEVTAFLDSSSIDESDLRAGIYDNCDISIRIVNWNDLTMGDMMVKKGTVGIVKMVNGMFTAEIRGLTQKLTTVLGATYGPVCRAIFGSGTNGIDMDSKYLCMFDVQTVRQTGTVDSVGDAATVVPVADLIGAAGWFDDGFLKFTSGVLDGKAYEIKTWDGTTLTLFLPMPEPPSHGDTFEIEPGCNHLVGPGGDCQNKFNNIVNFRGEPFIPGMDQILDYPNQ